MRILCVDALNRLHQMIRIWVPTCKITYDNGERMSCAWTQIRVGDFKKYNKLGIDIQVTTQNCILLLNPMNQRHIHE